jgi:hypothetical protein
MLSSVLCNDHLNCQLFQSNLIWQGTAGATLVSQLNFDHGMRSYFSGSKDELYYGDVRVEYVAYQDDIENPDIVSLAHNVSFWAQKLTHSISLCAQKLNHYVSFWAQKTLK